MTLSALGIFSAAGAGGVAGATYELISTSILGSATSSVSFDVSTYASTYKHLQVRASVRTSYPNPADFVKVTFNNDTTGYSRHGLSSNGSSTVSFGVTDQIGTHDIAGNTAGSSQFGAFVMDILDAYSTTKNKTVRIFGGHAGSWDVAQLTSGLWIDTTAVTSVKLESGNGANLSAASRFSIYGIKG
jgi:hypothetical protein